MSRHHHTIGGKGKPAAIKPPEVKQFLHWYACGHCDGIYMLSLHAGSNPIVIDCMCGAQTRGIIRLDEQGSTISHALTIEYAEKLE